MKTQIAKLNYLRIAPRKTRLVASMIKGLSINEAEAQLLVNPKRPSDAVLKLLRSAVANAKNNQKLDPEKLFVKEIRVDNGPMLKRFMPRAMGRASGIQKKSSHITLILGEMENLKAPRFKIAKVEKISKRVKEEMAKKSKKEKEEKEREKTKGAETQKQVEKPGFTKKFFRRKSI